MVTIKSKREIDIMRRCGKVVSEILIELAETAKAGVTTLDLDELAEKRCLEAGVKPAFKGYQGYRHSLCTSVNEQIVHGIPGKRTLKDGDIIGLDFGVILEGFYGDSAVTVPIGKPSDEALKLMRTTRASLYAGIEACRSGNTLKDVARAIEGTVKPFGYGVVREFVGHGIGQKLHEDPQIPNYEAGASNLKLRAGMTICLEPMISEGSAGVKVLEDRWTAVTDDGRLSAHYEHTILVTDGDPEVLTEWKSKPYGWQIN
jgi:methionyl aminopeptidase